MRNREFVFEPKKPYDLAAAEGGGGVVGLQFPKWCRILELVRTHFAAVGGEENPPRNSENAAEPHR